MKSVADRGRLTVVDLSFDVATLYSFEKQDLQSKFRIVVFRSRHAKTIIPKGNGIVPKPRR